jgi:adenylate cyclase
MNTKKRISEPGQGMDEKEVEDVSAWLVARGLAGDSEVALLYGFCERCLSAGLDLSRGMALIDTLHPVHEGRVFSWDRDKAVAAPVVAYGPSDPGRTSGGWEESPFYHLLQSGDSEMRCRLDGGGTTGFPIIDQLRQEGQTDYIAIVNRFDPDNAIGEMDCFYSRWTTTRPGGFSDADLSALRRLVPVLGLAVKSASLGRVAESLVEAYLGRDAGRRVLQGRMKRGAVEKIHAVLWFSDMRDYSSISEDMASDQLIPLLDDYAEAAISAIHGAGGDVLKLMGDGILAIFTADDAAGASHSALQAEADLRLRLATLGERRSAEGMAVASIYLGLHIGDVFYGNIGSNDRLDFTVVGQAVNEVSRIASMCRSAGRDVLFSSAFLASLPEADRPKLVSVGRYALRGFGRAQELFTLDPELSGRTRGGAKSEATPP